jgi:tol-pal system protein YbgF
MFESEKLGGGIMRHIPMKKLLITFTSFLLLGCATRKEIVQFKDDTQLMKNQLILLQNENKELKQKLQEIDQTIRKLEKQLSRDRADLLTEVEELKRQSQFLNQIIEDNISQISKYVTRPESRSYGRPQSMMQPQDSAGRDTASFRNPPDQIDAQKLYDSAYLDITRGNNELARMGFTEYLNRFPESALADNAQYWIGETYYALQDYRRAIEEFNKVVGNYPRGDKLAASLLKIGFSYFKLGNDTNGKKYLDQVIRQFPYSEEAKLAQNRISNLN